MALNSKVLLAAIGATLAVSSAKAQSWTDKITLGGDFRYRIERDLYGPNTQANVATPPSGTVDNWRQRIRARVMAAGKINDALTAKFRLSTGGVENAGSARTSNVDLGSSAFSAKRTFALDLSYFEYRVAPNWMIELGKMPNPFWRAGGSFMTWQADQTFEGVQTKYTFDNDTIKPFITLGYHVVSETTFATPPPDIALFSAQAGVNWKMDPITVGFALSSYNYNNVKGTPFTTIAGAGAASGYGGNSFDPAATGNFRYDYKLTGAGLEIGYSLGFAPLSVYTEYIQNSEPSDENKAMIAGVRLGALKDIGSWTIAYNYRDVRKDALLGYTTETSFLGGGGGTDVMGHQAQIGYQAWANTAVGITYDAGMRNISNPSPTQRQGSAEDIMIDLVSSF